MFRRAWQHALQPVRESIAQLSKTASEQPSHDRLGSASRQAVRQLFSSAESSQGAAGSQGSAPKSMLDATLPHNGAAGTALSGTAAARLAAVAAAEGAAGSADAGALPQAAKSGRKIAGRIFDFFLYTGLAATAAGGYAYSQYSIPEVEQALSEAEEQLQQEPSLTKQAWVQLLQAYLSVAVPIDQKVREYADPSAPVLLPDLAPELRGHVKTLVLDLEDLLVHKEWSRARGWQVMKRPGVEVFLVELGKQYELVIYTDEPAMYADPIINKIDPHRAVAYRLYRQDTQYHDGKHVRDLSRLNRDMRQVLFISADPDAYVFQPENTLKMRRWDHSPRDTTLLDLIPFLQMVQEAHVNDVRDVVRSYDGEEDVAAAFKQRMAQLAEQKKHKGWSRRS